MDYEQDPAEGGEISPERKAQDYSALCKTLKGWRDDAVTGRENDGIDKKWAEDEDFYDGIDDVNRGEKWIKPTSVDGRVTGMRENPGVRSTVFMEITRPYVDAASARAADMLLPTDDRNFVLEATPVPSLIDAMEDQSPAMDNGQPVMVPQMDDGGNPVMSPQMMGGQPMMGANGQPMMAPAQLPMTIGDQAKEAIERARMSSEKAQQRIDDWLSECEYIDEARRVIDDAARIGTGVIKGPIPKRLKHKAITKGPSGVSIAIESVIAPTTTWVDPWNIYPDPACGDNIHRGKFIFERDDISARTLLDLRELDGFISEAINEILREGPKTRDGAYTRKKDQEAYTENELFEVWYFYGFMSRKDMDVLDADYPEECECEQFPVIATIVNDKIIQATLNPLESGEFPYDVMVWQRIPGIWAGKGVARQMRTCQRGVNAAVRNLMDNAGLSAGPQIIINRDVIDPADGRWEIVPRKVWLAKGEDADVRKAFVVISIQSLQAELMAILDMWLKRAEDATGLPMLLQGQIGNAPDTVGGMTMLNNNATGVLRRIAKLFDGRITKQQLGRYYEWLLLDPEIPDDEKGDFTIKPRGSSALVERESYSQLLMQMLGVSLDPRYGVDPKKMMSEFLKAQRFDAEAVVMDDAQYQQIMERMNQPPQDSGMAIAQMRTEVEAAKIQSNERIKAAEIEQETRIAAAEDALARWEKAVDTELEQMRLNGDVSMNTDSLKVNLTNNVAKIRAQLQAIAMGKQKQIAAPAMEPFGRAQPGKAFQQ